MTKVLTPAAAAHQCRIGHLGRVQGLELDGQKPKRVCIILVGDFGTGLDRALEPGEGSQLSTGPHGLSKYGARCIVLCVPPQAAQIPHAPA